MADAQRLPRRSGTDEVRTLVVRWQHDGDRAAREELVRTFMPLARGLTRRYARSSIASEDLVQVASYGLLKAIDRYDVKREVTLRSFAVPTILGELRRHFRDSGWGVHVPRSAQERALDVRRARDTLSSEGGRAPTVDELAEYMELGAEEVLDGLFALNAYEPDSLDAPRRDDEETTLLELLGGDDDGYELSENSIVLRAQLRELPERDRELLRLRFVEELSQRQIGQRLALSQMQVSRLLRATLDSLRASLEGEPLGAS